MINMDLTRALEKTIFHTISSAALSIEQNSYVIGGYVRDFLLSKQYSHDIDIVTTGSGILLADLVATHLQPPPQVTVFKKFGTAMIKYQHREIEFVSARKESYRSDSRKPLIQYSSITEDQNRRDFTINTMAIGLNSDDYGRLIDPCSGLMDLHKKIISTPLDPFITYSDDPLRMLRAIRFASELNFIIDHQSLQAIRKNCTRLSIVSIERIMDEFQKIMLSPRPSIGLMLLYETGLLLLILPEIHALKGVEEKESHSHKDNFFHTLEVVDNISNMSNSLWLRWAALLHDIGKVVTKKYISHTGWTFYSHEAVGSLMIPGIFKRLKLPMGSVVKYVQKLVKYSSRPIALVTDESTDSALRRLLFDLGQDMNDLLTLCKADITTKNLVKKRQYRNNFIIVEKKLRDLEEKDRLRNWPSPVSGEDIMKMFNILPSPKVGIIKESIKEAILDGKISNHPNSIYLFMLQIGEKLGLDPKE